MHTRSDKLLYQIALTQIVGVGDITARNLLQAVGDEEAILKSSKKSLLAIRGVSAKLASEILNPSVLKRAEEELLFIEKNKLKTYFINEDKYPHRLRDCVDAPILLYFKGHADLNTAKIISIVGTRNSTSYGSEFCENFLHEIASTYPDMLIISGLAYGIDINAHRSALKHNLPTIGVLAHGLDRIYPYAHRKTAIEMIERGGLLTDFPSNTEPDRHNFVKRNRIVAGMTDVVIVVESNERGGSLITAEIASSYCKDVFAVPGKMTDVKSKGCNKLIASHKADLLLSTNYFLQQMGWDAESQKISKGPKQQKLFVELDAEQQQIVNILTANENIHVDRLAIETTTPIYLLLSILLELELKGIVRNLPGNLYSII